MRPYNAIPPFARVTTRMRTMRSLSLLLLPGLLLALAVRAAEPSDGRDIAYRSLYEPLAAVRQADPDGIVVRIVRVESAQTGQPLPADLKVELHDDPNRQSLLPSADGRIDLPLRADWAADGATLWINQPREVVVVSETFAMRTPTATRIDYARLMESLPVVERLQNQPTAIAGLMRDRPIGVELAFDPAAPQTIAIGTGPQARTWTTDAEGRVKIPFDPALPAATPVTLSALPVALQPYAH